MVGPPAESSFVLEELVMSKSRTRGAERPAAQSNPSKPGPAVEEASSAGCLVRLFWMGPGNLVLLYLGGSIARISSWTFTWRDIAFWLTVAALIAVRYLDVVRFEGLTVRAEPATLKHVRRYAALLVAFAFFIWLAAQSITA